MRIVRRGANVIKIIALFLILAGILFCMIKAANKMGAGQRSESLKQLDNSIRKAVMTCYATEGVYPPSVQYMKDNYGIQIDEDRFTVFYEVQGDNMMPDVTVMERQDIE